MSAPDAGLLEVVVRLVRLLDSPAEGRFRAPLVMREVVYRLWRGVQGGRLRHVAAHSGCTPPIAQAIMRLRKDFDQPLRIDRIARELGMSVSGFHRRFKAVTALSPLQFQKRLRLQEARRLMFGEGLDAANTAYRVGYRNASHFNREYKRLFGAPPMRDVERLREAARQNGGRGRRLGAGVEVTAYLRPRSKPSLQPQYLARRALGPRIRDDAHPAQSRPPPPG